LATLAVVDKIIYADLPISPLSAYSWANGLVAALFLALSYWQWAQDRLKGVYPIIMIALITITPILFHHLLLPKLPSGPLSNAEGITLRQWPVHFMGLVLVAWQYRLTPIIFFSLGTALLDLGTIRVFKPANPGTFTILTFITLIRTISFLVIGFFINRLMTRLRAQQDSLQRANIQLRHHASTLENLTISRERNRMARELHDTLAHTLSAISVQLETVKAYWEVEPDTAQNLLGQSLTATHSGLDETRRALKALRASPLEDLGLVLGIQKLAESARDRGNLQLELTLPVHPPSFSPDVEQCIYRVAQEAIENVLHHANAQKLTLALDFNQDGAFLSVRDDGLGFNLGKKKRSGHFGLSGMRERAELAGGELRIDSSPQKGTTIKLTIKGNFDESDHLR
jgi:signal transduction histidine kinase